MGGEKANVTILLLVLGGEYLKGEGAVSCQLNPIFPKPERLMGEKYTVESDVWSLGMSLLEMATGHFPIPKENLDQEPKPIHPPPKEPLDAEPEARGQSMAIFELLAHIVEGEPPTVPQQGDFTADFRSFVDGWCVRSERERGLPS